MFLCFTRCVQPQPTATADKQPAPQIPCTRSPYIPAGFPSVGKSTLLTKLTGTESEAAAYEFTTLTAVPGITRYHGARIQMLDLPGIIEGAADGKGRGRQVISTARTSDLILIVLDVLKPITHKLLIEKELEGFGIRLNKTPPKLVFRRKERGGISFVSHVQNPRLTRDECIAVRPPHILLQHACQTVVPRQPPQATFAHTVRSHLVATVVQKSTLWLSELSAWHASDADVAVEVLAME